MKVHRRNIVGFNQERAKMLFLGYPFKGFHQSLQGIEKQALAGFLVKELEKKINIASNAYWEVVNHDELLAVLLLEPLPAHSGIYGMKMSRISVLLNYKMHKECFNLLWEEIKHTIYQQGVQHISCRVDASEYQNISCLMNTGFRFCGVSLKMLLLNSGRSSGLQPIDRSDLMVRQAAPSDVDVISELMKEHKMNHYFYDSSLSKDGSKKLFSNWITGAVERQKGDNSVHVLFEKSNGKVIGFVNYQEPKMFNDTFGKRILVLDTIVVARDYQQRGCGYFLLTQSLAEKIRRYDQVELRVSQDNYSALNFYQGFGFKTIGADAWLSYSF